jgi:uncharacterized alkaline shock family protein YloU
MSETQGQSNDSPLLSERGVTTISDTVVSSLAGMAAQEVEGVHMGGGASRAAGGVLGSITGSESKTSGISVEIGQTEVAIDLRMGVEYNKNILETVEEVRQRITERVESTTGLRIKELNATITDITFPEKEAKRRLGRAKPQSEEREDGSEDDGSKDATETAPEVRTMPRSELRPGAGEREITEVEPTSRTHTEAESGPVPEEEVSVEGRPLKENETAESEATEVGTREPGATEAETTSVPAGEEEVTASVESSGAPEEATAVAETPPEEAETVVEERPPEEDEITEARTEEQLVDEASGSETTGEVQTPPDPETAEERMRRRAEERARRRRRRVQEEDG